MGRKNKKKSKKNNNSNSNSNTDNSTESNSNQKQPKIDAKDTETETSPKDDTSSLNVPDKTSAEEESPQKDKSEESVSAAKETEQTPSDANDSSQQDASSNQNNADSKDSTTEKTNAVQNDNNDEDEDPIVEREPKTNPNVNVAPSQAADTSATLRDSNTASENSHPQKQKQDQQWFNSSWTSWISDTTSNAMKTMQSQTNNIGRGIERFVKEEMLSQPAADQETSSATQRDAPKQQQEDSSSGQWISQASSVMSSWWNSAKSAEEVKFMSSMISDMKKDVVDFPKSTTSFSMISDMKKDVVDLGKSFLEETEELISESVNSSGGSSWLGSSHTGPRLVLEEGKSYPWLIYYQHALNGDHFPEKTLSQWLEEMPGSEKLASLQQLAQQSQASEESRNKVDAILNEANSLSLNLPEDEMKRIKNLMLSTPCGRELQRIYSKSRKFTSTLPQIQKEFYAFVTENLESREEALINFLQVSAQMQQHRSLELSRIMAQVASKSVSHVHSIIEQLHKKKQLSIPYELKAKKQEPSSSEEQDNDFVLKRIRDYVYFVVSQNAEVAKQFAMVSHELNELVREKCKELDTTSEDVSELLRLYMSQSERLPSMSIMCGNESSSVVISTLEPASAVLSELKDSKKDEESK